MKDTCRNNHQCRRSHTYVEYYLLTFYLYLVGPPSTPILFKSGQGDRNVHITWSIPEKDTVQYFQLYYSYQIRGCIGLNGTNNFMLSNYTRSHDLTNLEENSDLLITLSAVNQAGESTPATIKTHTLPAGESSKV